VQQQQQQLAGKSGSPLAAAAATAAVTSFRPAAAAAKPANLSCLCCYPPCLTEGVATEAHMYVLGLEPVAAAAAAAAGSDAAACSGSYHVLASFGSVVVADVRGVVRPQEGLFRCAFMMYSIWVHSTAQAVDHTIEKSITCLGRRVHDACCICARGSHVP
jgi:hypothetical protein